MEPKAIHKSNIPLACATLKERVAIILFYLANSKFAKADLIEIISEALTQLEWLGYPSITKRVKSLLIGLKRGMDGKNRADAKQDGAWGTSIIETSEYKDANVELNRYYHDLVFHPCDADFTGSRQKIQE